MLYDMIQIHNDHYCSRNQLFLGKLFKSNLAKRIMNIKLNIFKKFSSKPSPMTLLTLIQGLEAKG